MKFLNLQVSNGLEILLSMGNRLTLDIRSESAYKIGEVLKGFTKRPYWPGIIFFLPEDITERANPAGDPKPRRVFPPDLLLLHTLPVFYPHLSVNRGSVPWPAPWKGSGIFFRRCASPLSASRGSFRPVAMGVLLIPMSPLNPGSNR